MFMASSRCFLMLMSAAAVLLHADVCKGLCLLPCSLA
jgi:hypothetical protein